MSQFRCLNETILQQLLITQNDFILQLVNAMALVKYFVAFCLVTV